MAPVFSKLVLALACTGQLAAGFPGWQGDLVSRLGLGLGLVEVEMVQGVRS